MLLQDFDVGILIRACYEKLSSKPKSYFLSNLVPTNLEFGIFNLIIVLTSKHIWPFILSAYHGQYYVVHTMCT